MTNKELEFRTNEVSKLNKELIDTSERSSEMIEKFISNPKNDNLTLAWTAIEIITDVLERLQSELIKFNH